MANIFTKSWNTIKALWTIKDIGSVIKGGSMKNWTGIVKVITYVAALAALVFGYLPLETVVKITIIMSGVAKVAEIIAGLTPSKTDDARVAEVIKILKDKGIIKI